MQTVKDGNDILLKSDAFDPRYYGLNKRLLCIVGQWPDQSNLQRTAITIFVWILTCSLIIVQIIKIKDSRNEIGIIMECLPPLFTNILGNLKFANFVINHKKIKNILCETQKYWKEIRHLSEIEILQKYAAKGRHQTITYYLLLNTVVTAWCTLPLSTVFLDYIAPLNQSRSRIELFRAEYYVDPDKYFYVILLYGSAVTIVGVQTIIAIDTFYMSVAQHACAVFAILRFRLKNIIQKDDNLTVTLHPDFRQDVSYQQIVSCIKKHKDIIGYIQLVESSCKWSLFVIVGINMVMMSVTGYQVVAKGASTENIIRFSFFNIGQVIHLFCNTLPGQYIIDSSLTLSVAIYDCKWYLMSLRSRELIIFFLRRSFRPCTITAGKTYVMSMENFSAVLQTSMSYFTMLTSIQ